MPRRPVSMQPSSSLHELRVPVISVAVTIKDGNAGWLGYSGEEIFNPDTNIDTVIYPYCNSGYQCPCPHSSAVMLSIIP